MLSAVMPRDPSTPRLRRGCDNGPPKLQRRRQAGIQYSVASQLNVGVSGILGRPIKSGDDTDWRVYPDITAIPNSSHQRRKSDPKMARNTRIAVAKEGNRRDPWS